MARYLDSDLVHGGKDYVALVYPVHHWGPPDLVLRFAKKLKAISQFKSQKQIGEMVKILQKAGPWEYLRPVDFGLYNPSIYRDLFDVPPMTMTSIFR